MQPALSSWAGAVPSGPGFNLPQERDHTSQPEPHRRDRLTRSHSICLQAVILGSKVLTPADLPAIRPRLLRANRPHIARTRCVFNLLSRRLPE